MSVEEENDTMDIGGEELLQSGDLNPSLAR